ncbi:unnamed protein product [Caenorhabditis brenneri]
MIKTENSENEVDTITFAHCFRVRTTEVKHMLPKQFVTAHKYSLINWHIQVTASGGVPDFIRNMMEPPERRDPVYQVTLHHAGVREKYPPVESVEFKIRFVDSRDMFPPIRYVHPPGFPPRNVFNSGYSTPERGPIRDVLNSIIGKKQFDKMEIEVQTCIVFDVEKFLSVKYLNQSIGKPMPIDLGFRYNLLTNQSTHDFRLKTRTELSFPCNKEALFVASPYFRKNLTSEMTSFQLEVEHLEAIEIAVTWLFTETYHPPSKMTPELADEIVKLAGRIVPRGTILHQRQLMGSVERHCYEELIENRDDMMYVKHMLLVAHNNHLESLLEACHATIISYHYPDFCREVQKNPNPALIAQPLLARSNAMGRLTDNYMKSLVVKCYTRKAASAQ